MTTVTTVILYELWSRIVFFFFSLSIRFLHQLFYGETWVYQVCVSVSGSPWSESHLSDTVEPVLSIRVLSTPKCSRRLLRCLCSRCSCSTVCWALLSTSSNLCREQRGGKKQFRRSCLKSKTFQSLQHTILMHLSTTAVNTLAWLLGEYTHTHTNTQAPWCDLWPSSAGWG